MKREGGLIYLDEQECNRAYLAESPAVVHVSTVNQLVRSLAQHSMMSEMRFRRQRGDADPAVRVLAPVALNAAFDQIDMARGLIDQLNPDEKKAFIDPYLETFVRGDETAVA